MDLARDGLGLTGRVDHVLDEKGRLVVPARFRAGLGERFTVTIVPGDRCLALYSPDEWSVFCKRLEEATRSARKRQFERLLSEYTVEAVACDSQGRLLLGQAQRDFAEIEREVVTVGAFSRVEIWAKDRYKANVLSFEEAAAYADELKL